MTLDALNAAPSRELKAHSRSKSPVKKIAKAIEMADYSNLFGDDDAQPRQRGT
jgi:hypothetical protein